MMRTYINEHTHTWRGEETADKEEKPQYILYINNE